MEDVQSRIKDQALQVLTARLEKDMETKEKLKLAKEEDKAARAQAAAESKYPRLIQAVSKIKEKAKGFEVKLRILISLFQMLQGIGMHSQAQPPTHTRTKVLACRTQVVGLGQALPLTFAGRPSMDKFWSFSARSSSSTCRAPCLSTAWPTLGSSVRLHTSAQGWGQPSPPAHESSTTDTGSLILRTALPLLLIVLLVGVSNVLRCKKLPKLADICSSGWFFLCACKS